MQDRRTPASPRRAGRPSHQAFCYRGETEYLAGIGDFVHGALARGEPVLVALPDAGVRLVREHLAGSAGQVAFADMARLGRNPAWIIPAVQAFLDRHAGRRVSFVGEPAWPGRTAAALREATRHEALLNQAFAGDPVAILCPYDQAGLPAGVLADAERTHPLLGPPGAGLSSSAYLGRHGIPASCELPLPGPPAAADRLSYRDDLRPLRGLVARHAAQAGLSGQRAANLVLAASEIAANTLRHTPGGRGTLWVWETAAEVLCQLADRGHIIDPLAGRRHPDGDQAGGQGLWVVNQVCDLVEIRTSRSGTTTRLHVSRNR